MKSLKKNKGSSQKQKQKQKPPIDLAFEHQFWLQIIGDHLRFILTCVDHRETEIIQSATQLKETADQLLDDARNNQNVTNDAIELVKEVIQLKKEILLRHIEHRVEISLPPTFLNHMLNEMEEYNRILTGQFTDCRLPQDHLLNAHNLWLKDAVGHAEAIANRLDSVEKDKILEFRKFEKDFKILQMKSDEFIGYLRTGILDFPALQKLNNDAAFKILLFIKILEEIIELRLEKLILGSIAPLLMDHMIREECYYLYKIYQDQQKLGIKTPPIPFDPTQPRIED